MGAATARAGARANRVPSYFAGAVGAAVALPAWTHLSPGTVRSLIISKPIMDFCLLMSWSRAFKGWNLRSMFDGAARAPFTAAAVRFWSRTVAKEAPSHLEVCPGAAHGHI